MFSIESILADDLLDHSIQTRPVVVAEIENRKKISRIIAFFHEVVPLNLYSLSHLKRINSKIVPCQVIIAPVVEDLSNDCDIIENSLYQYGDKLKHFLSENNLTKLVIKNVPSKLPLTKAQFSQASLFWPVNFHEDKYISKCLNATLFSSEELKRISELMRETLDLISTNDNLESCKSAAIIVKNDRKFKVAQAISDTKSSPLNHATIMAIDQVAEIHNKAKNGQHESDADLTNFTDDYLCTEYECFLTQDPCIMCAMALVHSRIKRVFIYSDPNIPECIECNDHAFRTHKLHILDNLNHHYEVWKLSPSHADACEVNNEYVPNKKVKL